MKTYEYGTLVHNEQFIFANGDRFKDMDGTSHVYRKVIKNGDTHCFTMVEGKKGEELRDIRSKERVIKLRFFPR